MDMLLQRNHCCNAFVLGQCSRAPAEQTLEIAAEVLLMAVTSADVTSVPEHGVAGASSLQAAYYHGSTHLQAGSDELIIPDVSLVCLTSDTF